MGSNGGGKSSRGGWDFLDLGGVEANGLGVGGHCRVAGRVGVNSDRSSFPNED